MTDFYDRINIEILQAINKGDVIEDLVIWVYDDKEEQGEGVVRILPKQVKEAVDLIVQQARDMGADVEEPEREGGWGRVLSIPMIATSPQSIDLFRTLSEDLTQRTGIKLKEKHFKLVENGSLPE